MLCRTWHIKKWELKEAKTLKHTTCNIHMKVIIGYIKQQQRLHHIEMEKKGDGHKVWGFS